MRTLGLDMGERRIGVALSDPEGILASPLTVINSKGTKADIETILDLISQYDAKCIVVGMPRSLNGSLGRQAEQVQSFIHKLSQHVEIPIDTWDERLSTVAAEKLLRETRRPGSKKKAQIDSAAAAFILQGYLDRMRPKDGCNY